MIKEMGDTIAEEGLRVVELDALVVIRIMKHCRQHIPHAVTGLLLGLDVEDSMQVTGCFPTPAKKQVVDDFHNRQVEVHQDTEGDEKYQLEMLRALREVNVDSNTVGWYQSAYLGNFLSDTFVETQFLYQESINRSVVVVFDPLQSAAARVPFKAYQLTSEFMRRHKESKDANMPFGTAFADLSSKEMFNEIPIVVRSSPLVESFVVDWVQGNPEALTTKFDGLDLEQQVFLEKNVQFLLECLDDLAQEQVKLQQYERQAAKGYPMRRNDRYNRGPVQPRQLDTLLIARQIQTYCKQINTHATDSFGKLFLVANKPVGSN